MKGTAMETEIENRQELDRVKQGVELITQTLKLGVEGHLPENNLERGQKAAAHVAAFAAVEEAAYKTASPQQEPQLIPPYAAELVNGCEGDLVAVIEHPGFQDFVLHSLQLEPYEQQLSITEDGPEYGYIFPLEDPRNKALLSTASIEVSAMITAEKVASTSLPKEDKAGNTIDPRLKESKQIESTLSSTSNNVGIEGTKESKELDRAMAALAFAQGQQKHSIAHAAAGLGQSVNKVNAGTPTKAVTPNNNISY